MKGFIFDLDGVVVDTAKYHYLGWKILAQDLGFDFPASCNERQKGVSRMESLEIVLEAGNITGLSEEEKIELADRKNGYYLEMISNIGKDEILPGIEEFLQKLKKAGYKTALGSASKSASRILKQLEIEEYFDAVVDGNLVTKPKPDSEVFTKGADMLKIPYKDCTVVEDAKAGVEAAKAAGMKCIGIGSKEILKDADIVLKSTEDLLTVEI